MIKINDGARHSQVRSQGNTSSPRYGEYKLLLASYTLLYYIVKHVYQSTDYAAKIYFFENHVNRGANRWIATAAEEICLIQKRWGFTSIRQFSKFLQMNPRTLSKLPPSRWHIKDSLLRIMASAATVPQTLRDEVVDELENQL